MMYRLCQHLFINKYKSFLEVGKTTVIKGGLKMIEIQPNLFVGNDSDCIGLDKGWAIVHCAKEKWHRQFVGYRHRALSKDHKEYLYAIRDNEIALNMVDADKPEFFTEDMINSALTFINFYLGFGKKVLVHCNQGGSRSPSIAMLYIKDKLPQDFEEAEEEFKLLYPLYNPKNGIREYVRNHW